MQRNVLFLLAGLAVVLAGCSHVKETKNTKVLEDTSMK